MNSAYPTKIPPIGQQTRTPTHLPRIIPDPLPLPPGETFGGMCAPFYALAIELAEQDDNERHQRIIERLSSDGWRVTPGMVGDRRLARVIVKVAA